MIDSLNYYVKLYNILTDEQFIINNSYFSQSIDAPYMVTRIFVDNDIFDPTQNTATINLSFFDQLGTTKLLTPITRGGNIVQIFEAENNEIGNTIFVGYISSREFDQQSKESGTIIKLHCNSILMQLIEQLVVNESEDVLTLLGSDQPITDFVANQTALGNILQFMTVQSILSYVANKGIVNTGNQYNGQKLPFNVLDNAGTGFSIDSNVYYYASVDDDRLTSLLRTIKAYQMIIYQDLDGSIQITQPNVDNTNNGYYFNVGKFNTNIDTDSLLYKKFNYIDKSASVANRAYSSLINMGVNITSENANNNINYSASITGDLFPRPAELLDSGIFTMTKHNIVDMTSQMLTDPLLLNVITKALAGGNILVNDVSGIDIGTTAAGIYANMLLAEEMFKETQFTIPMARGAAVDRQNNLLPIPFGKTIEINDDGNLDFATNTYYCYGFTLDTDAEEGTELNLKLTKPYTATCVWSNV